MITFYNTFMIILWLICEQFVNIKIGSKFFGLTEENCFLININKACKLVIEKTLVLYIYNKEIIWCYNENNSREG